MFHKPGIEGNLVKNDSDSIGLEWALEFLHYSYNFPGDVDAPRHITLG